MNTPGFLAVAGITLAAFVVTFAGPIGSRLMRLGKFTKRLFGGKKAKPQPAADPAAKGA